MFYVFCLNIISSIKQDAKQDQSKQMKGHRFVDYKQFTMQYQCLFTYQPSYYMIPPQIPLNQIGTPSPIYYNSYPQYSFPNSYYFNHQMSMNYQSHEAQNVKDQNLCKQTSTSQNLNVRSHENNGAFEQKIRGRKRGQKKVIGFKYPKKNAESNIINQIFSYLSSAIKSKQMVLKLFKGNASKTAYFYQVMKQIKRKNKKYINRTYIKEMIQVKDTHIIRDVIGEMAQPQIEQLRKFLRTLVIHYLQELCIPTILTSAKLDKVTMNEHLKRRVEVLGFLKYHIRLNSRNL